MVGEGEEEALVDPLLWVKGEKGKERKKKGKEEPFLAVSPPGEAICLLFFSAVRCFWEYAEGE